MAKKAAKKAAKGAKKAAPKKAAKKAPAKKAAKKGGAKKAGGKKAAKKGGGGKKSGPRKPATPPPRDDEESTRRAPSAAAAPRRPQAVPPRPALAKSPSVESSRSGAAEGGRRGAPTGKTSPRPEVPSASDARAVRAGAGGGTAVREAGAKSDLARGAPQRVAVAAKAAPAAKASAPAKAAPPSAPAKAPAAPAKAGAKSAPAPKAPAPKAADREAEPAPGGDEAMEAPAPPPAPAPPAGPQGPRPMSPLRGRAGRFPQRAGAPGSTPQGPVRPGEVLTPPGQPKIEIIYDGPPPVPTPVLPNQPVRREGTRAKGERQSVLEANQGFYQALEARDMGLMCRIWANDGTARCSQPNGVLLRGWEEVRRNFESLFASDRPYKIELTQVYSEEADAIAYVSLVERVEMPQTVRPRREHVATNVFRLEKGSWKLVIHHAT